MTRRFPATRFDGRHAEGGEVLVHVEDFDLVVETATGTVVERTPLRNTKLSEPLDHAPRIVVLPTGATIEVSDADAAFATELVDAGVEAPLAVRLQARWPAVVVALALIVSGIVALYVKGLPVAAHWVAFALPPRLEARMGEQLMTALDRYYVRPSELDEAQRARIRDRFNRAAAAMVPDATYRLEFRSAGKSGINAFALPGGTIVLLDGLVKFVGSEDAVLGVLGHELGHAVHRHSMRQLVHSLAGGTIVSLLWGDFSGAASGVPLALGMMAYSRDFEREADDFAVRLLRAQGVPARPLYEFFAKVQALESQTGINDRFTFMSSHPSTRERRERLERLSHGLR